MGYTYDDYQDQDGEEDDHLLQKRMLLSELKKEFS